MLPTIRPYQLALIADDPVFRLGLQVWLEQFSDVDLVIEAADGSDALRLIRMRLAPQADPTATAEPEVIAETLDLVVVDLELGRTHSSQIQGITLCRQLHAEFPQMPLLLLGASAEPVMLAAARRVGAMGYCLKTAEPDAIATALRQVANRQPYWPQPTTDRFSALSKPQYRSSASASPSSIHSLKLHLRQSGISQIERAIADLNTQMRHPNLSLLDHAVLAGRRRELRAARWLVQQLLATPTLATPTEADSSPVLASGVDRQSSAGDRTLDPAVSQQLQPISTASATQPNASRLSTSLLGSAESTLTARGLRSVLFDGIFSNLQGSLENLTGMPLEIDILRSDKKRELFSLILRKLELLLDDLRCSQVSPDKLPDLRSQLLLDVWQATTIDFFGRYTTVSMQGKDTEIVNDLLLDANLVQTEILERIPLFAELLAHLHYQSPLIIDGMSYAVGNPAALRRAEALLSHAVIQLANSVVQPLLNRFADVEAVKQVFYNRRLISSREIERFRNDLSWRYRLQHFVADPRDIFESQYRLFMFCDRTIKAETIYSSRRDELEQLSGIPLVVTLVLETRDAVAPRIQSAVSFLGSGVVYILTEVIGRSIGLIGRGILKGVGSVVQDKRYSRNDERPR